MPNFVNGKIYKLVNIQTDQPFYVGSTCEKLGIRYSIHKYHHKIKFSNSNFCEYVEQIGGFNNVRIELICNFPCACRKELLEEEGRQCDIIGFDNLINQKRPFVNEEEIKLKRAQYYINNKKKLQELSRKSYKRNKEKYKQKYQENKEKHKQYYEDNKERMIETARRFYEKNADRMKIYHEAYRLANKEKMKEYQKKRNRECDIINCDCGSKVKSIQYSTHKKSKKHQNYLLRLNDNAGDDVSGDFDEHIL